MSTDLIARLSAILGPSGLITEEADMASYAIDWRRLFPGRPLCVARPASTAEVAEVVKACRAAGARLVPQGGNTGLAGGAVPDASGGEVVLSLTRMNKVRAIDPVGLTLAADAGCILKVAQDAAADAGRLLPISLAAEGSATVGGVVSTNAGGVNVLRYGMARALVLGLEVVLADGTIVDMARQLRKDNAGYDLKQLFIGTEGTLGIVTGVVLRLVPRPKHTVTALLSVPSPQAALDLLALAQEELGDTISAFELMSGYSFDLLKRHLSLTAPIAAGDWFVLIEAGASLSGLREAAESALAAALENGTALDGVIAETGAQATQLWALREHITDGEAREGKSMKHDVSVPIVAVPAFLEAADIAIAEGAPGAKVNAFGHLGDGNIHYNVVMAPGQDGAAINTLVHDVVARFSGSISAEHGIGQYRVDELLRRRAPAEVALALTVKRALDPDNFLNPGKVLPAPA
ncbi:FAD-binding oxidoreductase [Xanthobacter autotrophicus DSM 431]|uniref:FAD-binding oxidoreductase n=1 Tax=Xanthobacter nonsaccharivorans TaxID=3119912 RepID=UPI0037261D3B